MSVMFKNCRILDGNGHEMSSGFVVVEENRIGKVGKNVIPRMAKTDEVIDLKGHTVLPGMIDCHVHLCLDGDADPMAGLQRDHDSTIALKAARNASQTLLAGVTTVRDLGSVNDLGLYLRDAISAGITEGPRIYASGRCICMTGGHGWTMGLEANGDAEVRKAVREQLKIGADVIKLMATGGVMTPGNEAGAPQFTLEELKAGVEEAHKGGRKVASHVQGAEGIRNALQAGIDTIEHGIFIDDGIVTMFLERKSFLVPTLSAPYNILKNGIESGIPASIIEKTRKVAGANIDSARKAHKAGVSIAMGTDAGTPFNLHGANLKELELLCGIGLTPMEAISSASRSAARLLGLEQELGTIAEGMVADLIVVEGNPLEDITLLQKKDKILFVMKDGHFYKRSAAVA